MARGGAAVTVRGMTSPPPGDDLWRQVAWLLLLAVPVACVARTVVFEEVFREPRDWCKRQSELCRSLAARKFFYVFTCEYCLSHWIGLFFIVLTQFRLLLDDWRGYVLSFFALPFVANLYLNAYARLRVDITQAKVEIRKTEQELNGEGATPSEEGSSARQRAA